MKKLNKNQSEIERLALLNEPKNVTFKHTKRETVLFAPSYSCHSSVFDNAFKYIKSIGGNFKTNKLTPYSITFIFTK